MVPYQQAALCARAQKLLLPKGTTSAANQTQSFSLQPMR